MERQTRMCAGSLYNVDLYELDSFDLPSQYDKERPQFNRMLSIRWTGLRELMFRNQDRWLGGVGSKAEAQGLLEKGWPEGAERVRALAEKLAATIPPAKSVRRRLRWSDDGDEVSKDRLNGGFVESCWRTTRRDLATGPEVVTIETNWGGNCHLTAEQLFWQGAAAACLTDILEEAGYRVEVYANNYTRHRQGHTLVRVRVKEAEAPVRIDTLAAVLCHAAIFRVFGVAAIEQAPFAVDARHGHPMEISREQFEALEEKLGQDGRGTLTLGTVWDEPIARKVIEGEIGRLQE